MARFGITGKNVLGISVADLRELAKRIGRNHALALEIWDSGIFDARILAVFLADPKQLTRAQAEVMIKTCENWADCDGACIHLFRKTKFAHRLAIAWSRRRPEFVKRAGFTLVATLAVHDKAAADGVFLDYLKRLVPASADERNGVKKAVNWALRQIGKRNPNLRQHAIRTAERIHKLDTPAARWIANDARRELTRVSRESGRRA